MQRIVNRVVAAIARPSVVIFATLGGLGWVAGNLLVMWAGWQPWDPPPFPWLSGTASVVAFYITIVILATQRHDDQLARHRGMLTLELAILVEQKETRIIQMLEQTRPPSEPELPSVQTTLAALKEAHDR